MTKCSDLFIQCLEEEGVEYVFGVPGEENLDFLDSLSRSRKIKLVLTRHEQIVAMHPDVLRRSARCRRSRAGAPPR